MKSTYTQLWLFLILLLLVTVTCFLSCTNDGDDDDDDDMSGEEYPNEELTHGWVVGEYTSDSAAVLSTTDGGTTWEINAKDLPLVNFNDVFAVDDQTVWIVGDKDTNNKDYGTIYYTDNHGDEWQRQGDESILAGLSIHGVNATDSQTAWAVGDHGLILKTTNGGEHWEPQLDEDIPDTFLYKVEAVNDQVAWVIGDLDSTDNVTVLHTTNGGDDWERVDFQPNQYILLIDLSVIDEDNLWMCGTHGQAYNSTTGGVNWNSYALIPEMMHVNGVAAIDADSAYAATDQGGFYSTTNGGDWSDLSPSIEDVPSVKGYELMGITTGDGQDIWICAMASGAPDGMILHTENGGQKWERQAVPIQNSGFYRISFVGAAK